MIDIYTNNYLDQVILRIDYPSTPLNLGDGLPKEFLEIVLPEFPVPTTRRLVRKAYNIDVSEDKVGVKESQTVDEHIYKNKERTKSLVISDTYIYFLYRRWDKACFDEMRTLFHNIIFTMFKNFNIKVTRLGLRYINHIDLSQEGSETDPTEWNGYLNDKIISIFQFIDEEPQISRAFHDLELIFPEEIYVKFQYGMHNPDYPSQIRKKLFILDYDGYCEYLQHAEELDSNLTKIHEIIRKLFDKSIGPKLSGEQ